MVKRIVMHILADYQHAHGWLWASLKKKRRDTGTSSEKKNEFLMGDMTDSF